MHEFITNNLFNQEFLNNLTMLSAANRIYHKNRLLQIYIFASLIVCTGMLYICTINS